MKICFALSAAFFCLVLLPPSARAEIYQCDGKWTNLPCDGSISKTLPESISAQKNDDQEDAVEPPQEVSSSESGGTQEPLAPRYSLVRRLRKTSRDFYLKHKISLTKDELNAFEERCMKRETPLDQCQSQYDAFVQRLNSQIKK